MRKKTLNSLENEYQVMKEKNQIKKYENKMQMEKKRKIFTHQNDIIADRMKKGF